MELLENWSNTPPSNFTVNMENETEIERRVPDVRRSHRLTSAMLFRECIRDVVGRGVERLRGGTGGTSVDGLLYGKPTIASAVLRLSRHS